ncbi:glycosyltransferase family 4 protein [Halosimplex litoreum]|uniref:Glycosyltransferase family 4 protein n=1 Tax=Halosimplex litoreum TaxID=1198301 RepID=A0A7T3FZN6_9EURY|nr:glycosyltransferase family 4 protein [Halosimplex litoreum]QPV63203.1 glycosyltransferase family 4 protein [Halosimplex litoreum]
MSTRLCFVSLSAYGYFVDDPEIAGGGAQRQFYLLSRELAERYDVHMIVGDYGQPSRVVHDGVTLHRAYTPETVANPIEQAGQLRRLAAAMRAADADIYVSRGNPRLASVVRALARLLGGKWVYHVASDGHIETPERYVSGPFGRLYRAALTHADAIIAQTNRQQRVVAEEYGTTSIVVPNGYPAAEEVMAQSKREFVLWVGRLEPDEKRPHLFVDLASACPEIQFTMIGPWEAPDAYRQRLTARIEDTPNLKYVGTVPPGEIHDYYDRALAYVNTAAVEGFPNTFLEAWRAETAVASLDVDPSRFIDIDVEWTGFADGSMEKLAEQVRRIVVDEDFRAAVTEQCRAAFETEYTVETLVSNYAAVLDGLD